MRRTKWIAGVVAVLALMALAGWSFGWFAREDAAVAQVRELAAQPQSKENDEAIRKVVGGSMGDMKDLTPEQRFERFEQWAPVLIPIMSARFEAEYDEFMAKSPEEQRRELDKRIDEMQRRQAAGGRPGRGPGGGGGGGGGGRGGPPNIDPKKMGEFQKKMLAWTTPEQRAKWDNGIQLFRNRMVERGLTPPPMPGGGFF